VACVHRAGAVALDTPAPVSGQRFVAVTEPGRWLPGVTPAPILKEEDMRIIREGKATKCPSRNCGLTRTRPCSSANCTLLDHFTVSHDTDFYYFKPGGKWKYEGSGVFPNFDASRPSHDDISRVHGGRFPGINGDGREFMIVVIPRENCHNPCASPCIIRAEGRNDA
jgi:hypothetical protein